MKNTQSLFYCEHAFAIYDMVPYVNKLDKSKVFIISRKRYQRNIEDTLGINRKNQFYIEDLESKVLSKLTRLFILLTVRKDFSEFYQERRKLKFSKIEIFLSNISPFKIESSSVNSTYVRLINLFPKLNPVNSLFEAQDLANVLVVTKVSYPYIVSPFTRKTHVVVESWDHPAKEPFLIDAKSAEIWNDDLSKELSSYQNYRNIYTAKPLKFRYIKEIIAGDFDSTTPTKDELDDVLFIKDNNCIIYPMCTSSDYHAFEDEILFVKDLAQIVSNANFKLYVRPYPLAPATDAKRIKEIDNVHVGYLSSQKYGKEVFDRNHLLHKYMIMITAKGIVNLGTTFILDASMTNSLVPLIQIKIEESDYGKLGKYANGVHLKKYLHNGKELRMIDLKFNDMNLVYRKEIKAWVTNEMGNN